MNSTGLKSPEQLECMYKYSTEDTERDMESGILSTQASSTGSWPLQTELIQFGQVLREQRNRIAKEGANVGWIEILFGSYQRFAW